MKILWLKGKCVTADHDGYCSGGANEEKITYEYIPFKLPEDIDTEDNNNFKSFDYGIINGSIETSGSYYCIPSRNELRHEWVIYNPIFDHIETTDVFIPYMYNIDEKFNMKKLLDHVRDSN